MNKIVLSISAYDNLLSHLFEIQKGLNKTLNEHFRISSRERDAFYALIQNYIYSLEKIVDNISISENSDNSFPFVIIGSCVQLINSQTFEASTINIVFPHQENNAECNTSYISPLGLKLLLKRSGNIITIEEQSNPVQYIIGGITLV